VSDYRRLNYECNHSEEKGAQRDAIQAVTGSEVIPRINPELFRERKELGICIEALFFAIIAAISAWPIFAAAHALNSFLQITTS